jgi:hypothetical protein
VTPLIAANQTENLCPSKFTFWNDHCYYTERIELLPFTAANASCVNMLLDEEMKQFRSHLVRIDTPSTNRWIYELIRLEETKSQNPQHWWIGLHNLNQTSSYQWTSPRDINSEDFSLSWHLFRKNRPVFSTSTPHCVGFNKDYPNEQWMDFPCSTPCHFVCEAIRIYTSSQSMSILNISPNHQLLPESSAGTKLNFYGTS